MDLRINSMNKSKIKTIICIMGIPLSWFALATCVASLCSHVFYSGAFIIYALIAFLTCYVCKKMFLTEYVLFPFDMGLMHQLFVRGLPENLFNEIQNVIESNRLVVLDCPDNPFLRRALSNFVYKKGGFIKFNSSDEIRLTDA